MDQWKAATEFKMSESLPLIPFEDVKTIQVPSLPALNWRVTFGSGANCLIEHGLGVEVCGNALFEGVWAGNFKNFNFVDAKYVYGTGVALDHDSISFTPPTHTLEALYILYEKSTGKVTISNSIISCLANLDQNRAERIIDTFAKQSSDVTSEMTEAGVLGYDPIAYDSEDACIYVVMYHNFVVSACGRISLGVKIDDENFEDFRAYEKFLVSVLSQVNENGKSLHRKTALAGLSTISRGYDSAAVSALCAEIGIKHFCTIDATVGGFNDSGAEIAEYLGVHCREFPHPLGKVIPDLNAVLDDSHLSLMDVFLATVGIGDNYPLLAFDSVLKEKVLYTGGYGDVYWAKNQWRKPGFRLTKPFERSFTEYRLEKGFALVPVPSIGMLFPESLLTLTHKLEMRPWRIGGKYDRPIPRRILEERGVPRQAFGLRKSAVNPFAPNFADRKATSFRNILDRYLRSGHPT